MVSEPVQEPSLPPEPGAVEKLRQSIKPETIRLLRIAARIVVALWAGWWVVFGIVSGIGETVQFAEILFPAILLTMVFILPTVIACKWERIGGPILLVAGLIIAVLYLPMALNRSSSDWAFAVLPLLCIPPLISGSVLMFLNIGHDRQQFEGGNDGRDQDDR